MNGARCLESARTHSLERTSPFGELFVGRCVYCGETGLHPKDTHTPCPKGRSQEDALLDALTPKAPVATHQPD